MLSETALALTFDLCPLTPTQLHEPLRAAVLEKLPPLLEVFCMARLPLVLHTPHSCPSSLSVYLFGISWPCLLDFWNSGFPYMASDTSLTVPILLSCLKPLTGVPRPLRSPAWFARPCLVYLSPPLQPVPPQPQPPPHAPHLPHSSAFQSLFIPVCPCSCCSLP